MTLALQLSAAYLKIVHPRDIIEDRIHPSRLGEVRSKIGEVVRPQIGDQPLGFDDPQHPLDGPLVILHRAGADLRCFCLPPPIFEEAVAKLLDRQPLLGSGLPAGLQIILLVLVFRRRRLPVRNGPEIVDAPANPLAPLAVGMGRKGEVGVGLGGLPILGYDWGFLRVLG